MHSASIVQQKLIDLIGEYEVFTTQPFQEYETYIESNINRIELDFDLNNVIDCKDILYLFMGDLFFLNCFIRYYLSEWPKDDCVY